MIDLAKLRRWTKYKTAATESAKTAHKTIREALEEGELRGAADELEFATKLQGSYRNGTMVRGSGDVDILVIRTDTYHADFSRVPEHSRDFAPPINPLQAFEDHAEAVYRTLQYQYGAPNVSRDDKAIDIDSDSLPRGADVVPCLRHRKFWDKHPGNYMRGIAFWSEDGSIVVNFPERHRFQGARYQEWTNGNYKPTIRLFKNLRNELVENERLKKEQVPSYFIECLLSNVPVSILRDDDLRERVETTVEYLASQTDEELEAFTTQHGLRDLFGPAGTQWNLTEYHTLLDEVKAELLE